MAVLGRLAQCAFWFVIVGVCFLVLDLYT